MNSLRFCLAVDFCLWKFTLSPQEWRVGAPLILHHHGAKTKNIEQIASLWEPWRKGRSARQGQLISWRCWKGLSQTLWATSVDNIDSDMSHQASIRRKCAVVCCSDFSSTCSAYITSYFSDQCIYIYYLYYIMLYIYVAMYVILYILCTISVLSFVYCVR